MRTNSFVQYSFWGFNSLKYYMNRTSAKFWTLIFKISSFVCIAYESQQNNGSCVAPYVRMLIAFSDFTEERGVLYTG